MPSWYIDNDCVSIEKLQPIWFITISFFLQVLWTSFMFLKDSNATSHACITWAKLGLRIFTAGQILVISILDVVAMTNWISNHPESSGWEHFLCMGAIIFSSSNWKTAAVIGFYCFVITSPIYYSVPIQHVPKISLLDQLIIAMAAIYFISIISWLCAINFVGIFVILWPLLLFGVFVGCASEYLNCRSEWAWSEWLCGKHPKCVYGMVW
eukprot:375234_1